jgi:hypothetical protein
MNEAMYAVAMTTAKTADVSAGLKWGAALSGLGLLVLLYLLTAALSHQWNPTKVVEGFDGLASTSKFQWFLWLMVILFAYTALWVLRAEQGNYSALSEIPVNLLTVLGFSTATAAAAKGITAAYVQTGKVTKPGAAQGAAPKNTGGIFQDDNGVPELAKIQMVGFTIIAIAIFLATVIHQIVSNDVSAGLPNIDSSLMVLMGISQGGYLGKKLVTFGSPALYQPDPLTGPADTTVKLAGVNLGSQPGSQLMLNGEPIKVSSLSDTAIQLTVPGDDPATGVGWTELPKVVPIVVSVMGQMSDSVNFTVTAPPAQANAAPPVAAAPVAAAVAEPDAADHASE